MAMKLQWIKHRCFVQHIWEADLLVSSLTNDGKLPNKDYVKKIAITKTGAKFWYIEFKDEKAALLYRLKWN